MTGHPDEPYDTSLESRLRKEVVPVYDAMQADPARGIPIDEVEAALRAHHAARVKKDDA